MGVVDSYGLELIHPVRRGRSPQQFGAAGISNHRWIVGAKWCVVLNHLGEITGWVWAPANAHDSWFQPLVEVFDDRTVLLSDSGFHSAEGDPANLKICRRGEWNSRMLVETVLSMLTVVCHAKEDAAPSPDVLSNPCRPNGGGFQSLDRLVRLAGQ